MDEQRSEAFEKMLSFVVAEYNASVERMAQLKAAGKEKSATYRQMMGNKLQYGNILSLYKLHGLWNGDTK